MSNSAYDLSVFYSRTMRSALIAVVLTVLSMPVGYRKNKPPFHKF